MEGTSDFVPQTGIEWRGNTGVVNYGQNDNLVVLFYYRPTLNEAKSREHGRPYFDDIIYVRYHPPAERLNINDRPATDDHKRRWPMQWHQFQQNKVQVNEGTPIDMLYPEHPSIAATLRASAVHTIEQLGALEGTQIETVGMGAQRWVNDARRYLEAANKGVGVSKMRAELEVRDGEIRVLKQTIEQLKEEVARMRASNAGGGVSLEQVQALIASQQGRPLMPVGGHQAATQFDSATAQINATHPTTEVAATRRKRAARG